MLNKIFKYTLVLTLIGFLVGFNLPPRTVYTYTVKDIIGFDTPLSDYQGKVILIVNLASQCAFTPQYAELQKLYDEFGKDGLVVLGFPANNFNQEPETDEEVRHFCTQKYAITFPLFSKVSVSGDDIHPLFAFLTQKNQNARLDATVDWNFHKFIIDRRGRVVEHYQPKVKVYDQNVQKTLKKLLAEKS
jgi:glutathione peroxidase